MSASDAVTLSVDGMDYRGWTKVRIGAGILRQARDFELGITWKGPGQAQAVPIRPGARTEVRIGSDLVLTGYVDATPVNYDARQVTRRVTGRSLTADLVDCAAISEPGQWLGQSVQSIVQALASPYGIKVRSELGSTAVLSDHSIDPGETVFQSIDRLLTQSQLLSTDDPEGRVVIVQPGSAGRAFDRLEVGINILSGDAAQDFAPVFSEYRVIGQAAGSDDLFAEAANEIEVVLTDPRALRKRVLVINQTGKVTPELVRARAEWERASRVGRALTATYKVQGWRQRNGALWVPNMIVPVLDPIAGFDRDMLITEVEYSLDEGGTVATLTVAPPEAVEPEPKDPHRLRKLKRGGRADNFEYLLPADWESTL